VLHRFVAEDPCFRVERDALANETVIRGLGEMHLKTLLERMSEQHKLEIDTRAPSIPFRETIAGKAEGHSRHKKQTGGAGQFGEAYLRVEPLPRGGGFEFINEVKGGVIPTVYIPAVEKGVRMVLDAGFIAGFPLQDLRVTVYDGKSHAVDSKEVAFVAAGRKAFLDALAKARPIVLEPIVNVDIVTPDTHMGDLTGDLNARRAQVRGTGAPRAGIATIAAQVPLAELENFPTRLKSLTAGHGVYTLELSHYAPAPPNLQEKLIAAHKPREEEG
jgi:elongation factor G